MTTTMPSTTLQHNPEQLQSQDQVEEDLTSPLDRSKSLEKQLQARPEARDLRDRGILRGGGTAPALQSTAQELERNRATDSLKRNLAQRPEREELVGRNILTPSTTLAPALQSNAKELEKHMRRHSLEKRLQGRPTQEELVWRGVLGGSGNEEVIRE